MRATSSGSAACALEEAVRRTEKGGVEFFTTSDLPRDERDGRPRLMARTATLSFEGKSIELPVFEGTEGELGVDISQLRNQTGLITLDPGYRQHRRLHERHHLHRRREGHPPLPGHPDRAVRRAVDLRRNRLAPDLRPLAHEGRARPLQRAADLPRPPARGVQAPLRGLPVRRPAHGHAVGDDQHAVAASTRRSAPRTTREFYEEAAAA